MKAWDREYFLGATAYSTILGLNCLYALAFTTNEASHIITIVAGIAFSSGYVARNAGRPNFVIVQLAVVLRADVARACSRRRSFTIRLSAVSSFSTSSPT